VIEMAQRPNAYNRDAILKDLRVHVVELTIHTENGFKIFHLCLKPEYLPESYMRDMQDEIRFHEHNVDVINAWNVKEHRWQALTIDQIHYCQVIDAY
jgi:hypothetical protein